MYVVFDDYVTVPGLYVLCQLIPTALTNPPTAYVMLLTLTYECIANFTDQPKYNATLGFHQN